MIHSLKRRISAEGVLELAQAQTTFLVLVLTRLKHFMVNTQRASKATQKRCLRGVPCSLVCLAGGVLLAGAKRAIGKPLFKGKD